MIAAEDDDVGSPTKYCSNATATLVANRATVAMITWDSVRSTTIFAASLGLLCLLGYELFRRDPLVGKYVYDRKRLTQPDRSPPPLMISRSLWRGGGGGGGGGDDDDDVDDDPGGGCCSTAGRRCWPVCCPALLEMVFVTLDSDYIRYSRRADDARKSREMRGHVGCCRSGWFHRNCRSNYRGRSSSSTTADEDGYVFHPEYNGEYSHAYVPGYDDAGYSVGPNNETPVVEADNGAPSSSPEVRAVVVDEVVLTTTTTKRKNAYDLFPDDDPRRFFANSRGNGSAALGGGGGKRSLVQILGRSNSMGTSRSDNAVDGGGCEGMTLLDAFRNLGGDDCPISSPGIIKSTESVSNDAAAMSTHSPERGSSVEEDTKDGEKVPSRVCTPMRRNLTVTTREGNVGIDGEGQDSTGYTDVKYPSRLKYIFMPLGFHSWRSTFEGYADFFLLPVFSRLCRYAISKMPLSPTGHRRGDDFGRDMLPTAVPVTIPGKDLSEEEKELLRCAGLDTFLLIRFARFGFDATFYPYLVAFVFVLPVYKAMSDDENSLIPGEIKAGYLQFTINTIPNGSKMMIWIMLLTFFLYMYIMRRLWIEWEVFIKLRHDFLARGDTHSQIFKRPTYLRKYQNTCIVECIPKSHRSDKNLKDVFESLFPRETEHAEMLIDTSKLEDILQKRQALLDKYDNIDAKYRYERWLRKSRVGGSDPVKPMVRIGGLCSGEKQDALEYYNSKIIELEELASNEYNAIVETRMKCHNNSLIKSEDVSESSSFATNRLSRLYTLLVPISVRKAFGEEADFFYGTGVVTFNSIAGKQSAVQCNLSGKPYWMITEDAPDPRDVFWSNVGVDLVTIENRKILVQMVLLLGIIVWSYIVTFIQSIVKKSIEGIPIEEQGLGIKEVMPAWTVTFILMMIPNLFYALAIKVIRFKTHTQVDNFVLLWNTAYRVANIFVSFLVVSSAEAVSFFFECPEVFLKYLASGILGQAPYFMNLIILATGQETMLQLLQWRSLIKHALIRPLINLNAKSRRYHDWLNTAPAFEEAFIFGFFAPVLSYGLMIAMIFAFMVPSLLGMCAIFFWVATKVHTHNALFVYCQRFEGGGKIFFYWNRIIFIILYSAIVVFSLFLALKEFRSLAVGFFFTMIVITYCVSKSIESTFVIHSQHLPISIARIHDEEEVALLRDSQMQRDGGENFLYRHPILKHENWNSRHTWNFQ